MDSKLKYIGITHERATVAQRSLFALNAREQQMLRTSLMESFSLRGLLLFFTCNRAEIYFESYAVKGFVIKKFFLDFIQRMRETDTLPADIVTVHETTAQTARHLFLVANGLRSAIPGDKQVISQLRAAYKESLQYGHQGSLLERCIQHVFRSHKQVSNQMSHQDLSISVQTRIMGVLKEQYPARIKKLNLLILGAGAMASEILPALHISKMCKVHIANRTHDRAAKLASHYSIPVVDWKSVEANTLDSFDVIITAVSHCKNLITHIEPGLNKKVLIDLAMPANIKSSVQCEGVILYDVDSLYKSEYSPQVNASRNLAHINQIIQKESSCFFKWLEQRTQRLDKAA